MTSHQNTDQTFSDTASQPDEHLITTPKTSAAATSLHGLKSSESYPASQMATTEFPPSGKVAGNQIDAKTRISSLLKEKEQEWAAVTQRKGPLCLLDLPMDVLKEIVKEVTHTNDLTALALTHSALHNLAIPHIYSRFDIVWPDAHATTDPRTGVDALTYGLATLCMGDVLTNNAQSHVATQQFSCTNCGALNTGRCGHIQNSVNETGLRRLGNQYPQYTRKFSLGNGPADWVQEYLITKESGKMLGTLVALAVARMINLETFVWDMPTGVLRDVWLALSSLQNKRPDHECRLERVWVRWHDNSDPANLSPSQSPNTPSNATSTMTPIGWSVPAGYVPSPQGLSHTISYAHGRVEYPTLSVLPPLKSLSVLDIDELDYLDEMSMLIAKSKDVLRELRVGISAKAAHRDFTLAWDGPDLHQVDHKAQWPGASTIGERRLGGVLGVLVGRVFDIRRKPKVKQEKKDWSATMALSTPIPLESQLLQTHATSPEATPNDQIIPANGQGNSLANPLSEHWQEDSAVSSSVMSPPSVTFSNDGTPPSNDSEIFIPNSHGQLDSAVDSGQSDIESLAALMSAHQIAPNQSPQNHTVLESEPITGLQPLRRTKSQSQRQSHFSEPSTYDRKKLEGRLTLQTLELERIPLSVAVLQKAFDWSILTNLTILDCSQHDRLWTMLRRHFQPTPLGVGQASAKHSSGPSFQYHLNLRKVHTDAASPSLIAFLKDTLAPNTLETLFLQDRRRSLSTNVTIEAIYRGPLKRHRASLKRLMLDSSDRIPRSPTSSAENTRWRAWMPTHDVLNFITSGRMSSLRELSIAIDYKDWHHFLQRLPQIPHLRSLNVPYIADHVTPAFDPKELAMQVVDVIVLRPEVELCYMGVSHKCFEILENRPNDEAHRSSEILSGATNGLPAGAVTDDDEDDDEDEVTEDEDEEEEEEDDGTAIGAPVGIDPDETESDISDHDDSDSDSFDDTENGPSKVRLRLREILFYDDKVAIFKARHGRL